MDLQIKIDGQFVDIFPDTKIKYVFNSPAFGTDLIMGDVSELINLPATGKNKAIFSHLHRPDAFDTMNKTYDCEIVSNGVPIIKGTFKLKKASLSGFRGNVVGGVAELKDSISEKKLTDIDFGSEITLGANDAQARSYLVSAAQSSYPTYPMVAPPVKNELFLGEDVQEVTSFNSENDEAANGFVNKFFSDKFADLSGDIYHYSEENGVVFIFCPFLYNKYLLDKLFDAYGYSLSGDFYTDSELSTLIIHHLNCANEALYDTIAPLSVDPADLLPAMGIKDYLKALKNMFCLGYFYNYRQKQFNIEPLKNLLDEDILDWTGKAEPVDEILSDDDKKDGYKMSFEWDSNDEIPDDYIKSLDGYTIKTTVNSIAHLPASGNTTGDVRYVRYECAYYLWCKNDSGTLEWQAFSYPYQNMDVDEGENLLSTKLTPIPSAIIDLTGWDQDLEDWVPIEYKAPFMKQIGNCPHVNNVMGNEFDGRLLFYRGIKTDSRGYYYPLASADALDIHGSSTGNYTLQWDGDKGLYQQWWRDWHEFLDNTKETKWNLHLKLSDVIELDMRKRIRIKNVVYLIKKITVQFPFSGKATAALMKITPDITPESSSSSSVLKGDFANESPNDDFNNDFWNN